MAKRKRKPIVHPPRRCANPRCKKIFIPTDARMKFHNDACRIETNNRRAAELLRRARELMAASGAR